MRLASIRLPGEIEPWARLGFSCDDGRIALVNGAIEPGHDVVSLVVHPDDGDEVVPADLEGIPLEVDDQPNPAVAHPNGALDLDHLVIMTPDLDATSTAVESALGLPRRRLRETSDVRQAFHRFDRTLTGAPGCIVELVERADPGSGAPVVWGLVVDVLDLERVAAAHDEVGVPRDAVQPGRRIATVARRAGLGLAVALMSPDS
ncbi:MAG: hypothetical protein HKN41_08155 [Ilumatobacter sp.]|nr:hypothetical protein [Ilumatobacter sp.]